MTNAGSVHGWQLFWVDLEPIVGSEQGGGRRPALIISNDGFNSHFDLVTVLPLTKSRGKRRKRYSFEIPFPRGVAGNAEESIAMPQQIRTISKRRLLKPMGVLNDRELQADIENRLLEHLGIDFLVADSSA